MQSRHPNQQLEQDLAANEEEEGIDLERLKELLGFVIRAPLRRPFLAAAVFLLGGALGIAIAVTLPRTYSSQVKLLAQVNLVVPALSNPESRVPRDANNPTKDLSDQILRRDNIIALAKETNLVERYYAARSPALKLKDKLLSGALSDEDKLQIVVATLEKNVTVTVLDSNVTIAVDWYDPQMAYGLVTTVQKNFQSARYDDDVAMITDAISVLQDHAKVEAAAVDAALEEYRKVILVVPPPTPGSVVPRAPRYIAPRATPGTAAATATIDPDLAQALEDKRQQIRSLESQRQRDLEQLRGQLAQAQLTFTPQHPTVIALQQKVDSLSAPDPQLAQLKADERALMASIVPPAPPPPVKPPSGNTNAAPQEAPGPADPPPLASTLGTPKEDPRVQLIRAKLEGAIHRYQDAVARIDGANMELDIARTAFKYRYTVVTPAEVPKKPKKAVGPIVGTSSVIAALLLAFLIAAAADLGSGRILEEWQVRRQLKLEILGEFDPKLPPGPA